MKKLFSIALCFLAIACQKEIYESPEGTSDSEEDISLITSTTISLEDALNALNEMQADLYPDTKADDCIADIEVVGMEMTKSSGIESIMPDTLMYLVNFKEGGYAVLSGQSRIPCPVLCITEKGSISSKQMKEEYLELLDSDSNTSVGDIDENDDDNAAIVETDCLAGRLMNAAICQYLDPSEEETTGTKLCDAGSGGGGGTQTKWGPFIKTKWGQEYPFNNYLYKRYGSYNYPVGCGGIAVGQILTYYKKGNPDNMNFNWAYLCEINASASYSYSSFTPAVDAELQRFLEYIGNSKNLSTKYAVGSSTCTYNGIVRTMKNFGYTNVYKFGTKTETKTITKKVRVGIFWYYKTYKYTVVVPDYNAIVSKIKNGFPIMMVGSSGGKNHVWIADGYYYYYKRGAKEEFLHCNWGYAGDGDGYYYFGLFDSSLRQGYEPNIDPGTNNISFKYDYEYAINYN